MNSVPEHIAEDVTEKTATDKDRRHGMKLICSQPKSRPRRFRIEVEDGLLHEDSKGVLPVNGINGQRDKAVGSAVFIAALAGLAIGFFMGRRRED